MKNYLYGIALLGICFISTQCDSAGQVLNTGSRVQLDGMYRIQSIEGENALNAQTIRFSGLSRTVTGNGGCNTYNASFTVDNLVLNIGEIASTRKTCPDIDAENKLFEALRKVRYYSSRDNQLTLYAADNETILVRATERENTE
ncbi:META domain-containing protein [Nonlabens xiamenensis]|uniref:META domain-containing protein n=1 Tax=Nonlabens xiamenensis TaxID=2341043 RepID=UPI0013DDDF24|nr:META domain-containing protein [Nonlabens xiamenensis]